MEPDDAEIRSAKLPPIEHKMGPKVRDRHPLLIFFTIQRMTHCEGMNWLQGNGWISDLCVSAYDVALCDVRRVLEAAKAKTGIDWPRICLTTIDPERQCARPDWRAKYNEPWSH